MGPLSRVLKAIVKIEAYVKWTFRTEFAESVFLYSIPVKWSSDLSALIFKVKVKVWTLAIAPITWVRLVTSSAIQSRKWLLIGISQWCRSALYGHPLPALTDNWTHGASSRHTIPQSAILGLHPVACTGPVMGRTRNLSVIRVRYSTTTPLNC